MTDSNRQRGTRLTSSDRREQILISAQQLFASRPYEEVSTTELAEAAGTSRTNLHHHFGTKRALYLAVVHRFARFPMPPPVSTESGNVEDDVSQTFKGWLDLVEQNKETYLSMIGASLVHHDPEVEAVLRKGMQLWENRLLSVLRAPLTELNRAQIRAFQSLLSTATDEWLRSEHLSRGEVHELLNRTLLALPMEQLATLDSLSGVDHTCPDAASAGWDQFSDATRTGWRTVARECTSDIKVDRRPPAERPRP